MKKLRHLFILLAVLFTSLATTAQQSSTEADTDVALIRDSVLLKNCLLLIDSNNNITPAEVINKSWAPLSTYKVKTHIPANWVTKRVYLKMPVTNSAAINDTIYFLPGISFSSIKIFELTENGQLQQVEDKSRLSGYQPLIIQIGRAHV